MNLDFEHDGHRFVVAEREIAPAPERRVKWVVEMDGKQVLEFQGAYPYRDEDVRKRILEWYGIQKPIG